MSMIIIQDVGTELHTIVWIFGFFFLLVLQFIKVSAGVEQTCVVAENLQGLHVQYMQHACKNECDVLRIARRVVSKRDVGQGYKAECEIYKEKR